MSYLLQWLINKRDTTQEEQQAEERASIFQFETKVEAVYTKYSQVSE